MRATRIMMGAVPALVLACAVAGCAVPGAAAPASAPTTTTVVAPSPQTVYVTPPGTQTVYVPSPGYPPAQSQWYAQRQWIDSQPWITIMPAPGQTPCQWLHANGYTYAQAFAAWAQNDYPANWSATNDGYPCQRSYGMQH